MSTNNKWQALSMKDRAFLIREAVRNGITDINSIRDTWEHRFDGESNQPTEDEYIVQRAKERIQQAQDKAYNRTETVIPVFGEKTEADRIRQAKELEDARGLYNMYKTFKQKIDRGELIGVDFGFGYLDKKQINKVLSEAEAKLMHATHLHHADKLIGPGCVATSMDNYEKNCISNQQFAENPEKYGFVKIGNKEIKPGDIVQFDRKHMLMSNTQSTNNQGELTNPLNMRYSGSNGYDAVRKGSRYPADWRDIEAYRFVGDKADSLQWKKEYREKYSHQFSGEDNNEINWKSVGSTLYDIAEIVDPTGISSWATPEGDLYQAVKNYKEGTGSIGDIALNTLGALPILGPIGKAIKIGKGGARIAKTISKAAKNAKVIDDFLELIPGIKKATSATQAVTGAATQALGDVLNLSNNARFWTNKGIQVLNTANTMSDVVGAIGNTIDRDYTQDSPSVTLEDPNTGINKALLDASRRLEEEENSKNNRRGGWDEKNKRWYPHPSPEGGAHTIGYGIKLNPNTKWAKVVEEQGYLSEDQEKQARLEMLEESERLARTSYDNRFGKGEWNKLDFKPQSLLIDRTYNAGSISKFPNFVKAIHDGDLEGMRDQYKVYMTKGKGKRKKKVELGRNKTISREIDSLEQGFYPIFREN